MTVRTMSQVLTIAWALAAPMLAQADQELPEDGAVKSLAFSGDGKYLVAASWSEAQMKGSGCATVWEMPSGKVVFSRPAPMGFPLASFSADSKRLGIGSFTE